MVFEGPMHSCRSAYQLDGVAQLVANPSYANSTTDKNSPICNSPQIVMTFQQLMQFLILLNLGCHKKKDKILFKNLLTSL